MKQTIRIPATPNRIGILERIAKMLHALPAGVAWQVEVGEWKPKRSHSQNSMLWAMYEQIISLGGVAMEGWTKEDLHRFFLLEHFGSETRVIFGRKRLVPVKGSSKLTKAEFSDHVSFIVNFMSDQGVFLEMPDDWREAA